MSALLRGGSPAAVRRGRAPRGRRRRARAAAPAPACPRCFAPLPALPDAAPRCEGCGVSLGERASALPARALDLVPTGEGVSDVALPGGGKSARDPFKTALGAAIYPLYRRLLFGLAGYPAVGEDFAAAQAALARSAGAGGDLLELSCGPGVFTARFARAGAWRSVTASDFSAAMLCECGKALSGALGEARAAEVALVRADVARLPFQDASFDAVHAGAAMHCWPRPAKGVAEVARVLKPGGVFATTTVVLPPKGAQGSAAGAAIGDAAIGDAASATKAQANADAVRASGRPFADMAELSACFQGAGFASVTVESTNRAYVRLTATR